MNLATANEDAKKESAKMSKLISDNGGGIGGFGRLMWDGIKSGFDTKQPCVFAHTVGEFTFGIILGVLTGGEALASTAVGKAIKKWVVICDKLDIVGQAVSKTAGCVLKISYQAGKPVFNVLYQGVKVIPKFFEAPVSGKLYSFILPLPQVNLKGGIEAFKEAIAKGEVKVERVLDEADNVIVDEEGNILSKAITKEGEEVELLEKVDLGVEVVMFNKMLDALKKNAALQEHIFKGDYKKVTGCHYRPGVDGVNVRFVNDAIPEANSLGVLKGDIEMRRPLLDAKGNIISFKWELKITRDGPQTFFPSTWSKDKILEECASALVNGKKVLVPGKTRMYTAESKSGIFMKWFEDDLGNVTSIFPEFY